MKKVRDIMNRHGLLYAVTVERRGPVTELGVKSALDHSGIVEEYFLTDPHGVFQWIVGQILPQLVAQGRVAGSIHQPNPDLVVGLFSHRDDAVVERFQAALEVDRELVEAMRVSKP